MDGTRFDSLARALGGGRMTRQLALRAVAGAALAAIAGGHQAPAKGSRKWRSGQEPRGRSRSRQEAPGHSRGDQKPASDERVAAVACLGGRNTCKRSAQCCSGLCKKRKGKKAGKCSPCRPNCAGRDCGPNGCGGSCGGCPPGLICDNNGICVGDCSAGQKPCRGGCIPNGQCCGAGECAGGKVCLNNGCTCRAGELDCGAVCLSPNQCCPGSRRPCYTGPAGTAGKGICKAGTQECDDFAEWGACLGQVLPRAETCNGIDDDCDGVVDGSDPCPGDAVCRNGGCCIPQGKECEGVDLPCCGGLRCAPLRPGFPEESMVCK